MTPEHNFTPALTDASNAVQRAAAALKSSAPTPPGLRAKVGALLLRLVDRILWWHLLLIRDLGAALAERDRAGLNALSEIDKNFKELSDQINRNERYSQLETAQLDLQSAQLNYASHDEITSLNHELADLTAQVRMLSRQINAVQARTGVADKLMVDLRLQMKPAETQAGGHVNGSSAIRNRELANKIQAAAAALERFRTAPMPVDTAAPLKADKASARG